MIKRNQKEDLRNEMEKEEGRRAGFWFLAKQKWKRVKREQVHLVAKLQKACFSKEERKKIFIFIFQRLSDSNKSLPSCSFFFFSLSTHFPVCCLASFLPHKDKRNPTLEGEQGLSLLLLFGGFFFLWTFGDLVKKTFFFFSLERNFVELSQWPRYLKETSHSQQQLT